MNRPVTAHARRVCSEPSSGHAAPIDSCGAQINQPVAAQPRVVLVTRRTEFQQLLDRHGTREQAKFFLKMRGQQIENVEQRHHQFEQALGTVLQAIPVQWRRARVDRFDLDRFLFQPADIIVALGQDGLVANTAKYLDSQPVIGLNPSPDMYAGVLVRHPPEAVFELLPHAVDGKGSSEFRTMVEAELDDGQRLLALNEIFIGHRTHQSAKYRIRWAGREERQSSSGIIVSTGTGSTGWSRSIYRERACELDLPTPCEGRLVFFVREAWPSIATHTELTEGPIEGTQTLEVVSRMDDLGVIFGDGIEDDRLEFNWGRRVNLRIAKTRLQLICA